MVLQIFLKQNLFVSCRHIREIKSQCFCSNYRGSFLGGRYIQEFSIGRPVIVQKKAIPSLSHNLNSNWRSAAIMYSTSAKVPDPDVKQTEETPPSESKRSKLKKTIKEYGATVIVFHVAISLTSLGLSYLLISSGLDIVAILEKLGVGQSILESKITQGASTFVIAYAVHKVFAPVRITITLSATPFIVRYLRNINVLRKPV